MLYPFSPAESPILLCITCLLSAFLMILASAYCIFIPIAYTYKIKKPPFLKFTLFSFLILVLSLATLVIYIKFFDQYIFFSITHPRVIIPAVCIIATTILVIKKRKKEKCG